MILSIFFEKQREDLIFRRRTPAIINQSSSSGGLNHSQMRDTA